MKAAIERLQPYHSRKKPHLKVLGYLQAVNNWDKHRTLLSALAGMVTCEHSISFEVGQTSLLSHQTFNRTIQAGTVVARFQMGKSERGAKVKVGHKISAVPIFDKRMPKEIRSVPVFMALGGACEFIKDTIFPVFDNLLKPSP